LTLQQVENTETTNFYSRLLCRSILDSGSNRKHRFPAHPSNKRYQKYRVLRSPHAREQLRDWVERTSPSVAKPQVFKRFRSDNCEQRSLAPSASRAHAAHSSS